MKQAILTLSLICCGPLLAPAEIPPGWSTNLEAALKVTVTPERPILLYFTADWCGPCKMMAATTLKHQTVLSDLAGFTLVALDLDNNQEAAAAKGVSGIPAFLALTADGEVVTRSTGYMDSEGFHSWLGKAQKDFLAAQKRRELFARQQGDIQSSLKSADPSQRKEAIASLFELSADKEASRRAFALTQLKEVAKRSPNELLEGLAHPRLAVRINASNLLREAWGKDFNYDPWAAEPNRTAALNKLRGR